MKRRGSALIICLLLISALLILALTFLSQHASESQATRRWTLAHQARELARAGLEDARAKLAVDIRFPPPSPANSTVYVYSEDFYANDGTTLLGTFEVEIDSALQAPPYEVLRLRSRGWIGPRQEPTAIYELRAEIDIAQENRNGNGAVNPGLWQWTQFSDLGGI
jgi:hypothetical protein